MRASFMVLCQFASTMEGGEPMIVGIFRGVHVTEFPAVLERFFIAVELEWDASEEERETELLLRMIDEDGRTLYEDKARVELRRRPDYLPSYMWIPIPVDLTQAVERAGNYRFDLSERDEILGQATLEIQAH